jgi:hypothetical protein
VSLESNQGETVIPGLRVADQREFGGSLYCGSMFLRRVISEADDVGEDTDAAIMHEDKQQSIDSLQEQALLPQEASCESMQLADENDEKPCAVAAHASPLLSIDKNEAAQNNLALPQPAIVVEPDTSNLETSMLQSPAKETQLDDENEHLENAMQIQEVQVPTSSAPFPGSGTGSLRGASMLLSQLQQQYYSSSSLSGDEEDEDEPLVKITKPKSTAAPPPPPLQRPPPFPPSQPTTALPRPNFSRQSSASSSGSSRRALSSHNSSRDWGWFEDVHLSAGSPGVFVRTGAAAEHGGHHDQDGNILLPVSHTGTFGSSRRLRCCIDESQCPIPQLTH